MNLKRFARGPAIMIAVAVLLVMIGVMQFASGGGYQRVNTATGISLLNDDRVAQATVVGGDNRVDLTLRDSYSQDGKDLGKKVQFYYVDPRGQDVVKAVASAKLDKPYNDDPAHDSWVATLLVNIIPFALFIGLLWLLMNQVQGGGSRVMSFGKSRAKLVSKESPKVTFSDVAGADEAVEELHEIKEFLQDPGKFQAVGAKIPKGVLLYGQPGTGKTLLARAVAGEAGVPFYSISGSDFVEMFVGVGASRVRDLFEQAKNNAPAIIFVDEIDAVGRHRGAGMGGGHDEREQTLNQLLVEMDGFDPKTNVILIAATNRPDILDPALLRPGRFDRQIAIDPPDLEGRNKILQVHGKGKPLAPDVDLRAVAKRTPGMSGADLANVLNEAALLTARAGARVIDNEALDEAIDRVVAGPQKRTRIMNDHEKKVTAYHEGGHALVAAAMRHLDPVTKVTILPRGRALGYTMVAPAQDKYGHSRNELLDQLAYSLGGRVAEEMVFHDPTTGAANDIEKASGLARRMVTQFGMSEKVGAVKLGEDNSEPFMGMGGGQQRSYSEGMAEVVDKEVRTLLDNANQEAWEVLMQYRDVLDTLVLELLDKETLNTEQLAAIFAPVQKRELRPVWLSSTERHVSDIPPVLAPGERRALNGSTKPQDEAAMAGSEGHQPGFVPGGSEPTPGGAGTSTGGWASAAE